MAKTSDIKLILEFLGKAGNEVSKAEIRSELKKKSGDACPSDATLKRRLSELVDNGEITKSGKGPAIKYKRAITASETAPVEPYVPTSAEGREIRQYVCKPISERTPVGYNREFIEDYLPNETHYLSEEIRDRLFKIGKTKREQQAAGTYAREILSRLLIDLSWASSKLEGNTYTRLDTQNLIEAGEAADGKERLEATMILNHKTAIEMLIEGAEEIDFNTYTFLNLHAALSDNLLGDPNDSGRVRERIVEIGGTPYLPLRIPQQLEHYFRLILDKARDIDDPFEQSFFIMVHIPYLQPFADVNKRVSRLGANIPLIKNNLCPLSFIDVPEKAYVEGTLGIYELNRISLLRDVFVWAYERSCRQYNAIEQNIAEPDPFRLKYRQILYSVIGQIVKGQLHANAEKVSEIARHQIANEDINTFSNMVDEELENLHEGNLSRYKIRLSEFSDWKQVQEASREARASAANRPIRR